MTNRRPMPMASPSARRTRAASEWKVPATTSRPPSPTRLMIRSRSSDAARFVKVTARIRQGGTSLMLTRYAIRWARTRVLPDPAPARISSGPSVVVTARACSGLSARTICSSRAARAAALTAGSTTGGGAAGSFVSAGASRIQAGSSGTLAGASARSMKAVPVAVLAASAAASSVGSPERRRRAGLTRSL